MYLDSKYMYFWCHQSAGFSDTFNIGIGERSEPPSRRWMRSFACLLCLLRCGAVSVLLVKLVNSGVEKGDVSEPDAVAENAHLFSVKTFIPSKCLWTNLAHHLFASELEILQFIEAGAPPSA